MARMGFCGKVTIAWMDLGTTNSVVCIATAVHLPSPSVQK